MIIKKEKNKIKVITYGTFDLFHVGHVNLLKRASELGDHLTVAISTDEFNWDAKNKKCHYIYEDRKKIVESIKYVDEVIPETDWEQKKIDVVDHDIDIFVIGDDWKGHFDFLEDQGVKVVYLSRTPDISTTQIKEELKK